MKQRNCRYGREWNPLERAFLRQSVVDDLRGGMEFIVPEKVDHVVEVARTRPLGKSAHLLGEDFLVAITPRHNPALGSVGIWVRDGAIDGWQHQQLVGLTSNRISAVR